MIIPKGKGRIFVLNMTVSLSVGVSLFVDIKNTEDGSIII